MTRDDVEARCGGDDLALVRLDGDLAPSIQRRVDDREDLGADQGGVVDEQAATRDHSRDQRPVHEFVLAVVGLGVLADEVGNRGVAVPCDRDQVGERRLDQRGLAGTGRSVQESGDAGFAQASQGRDVGQIGKEPRVVGLAVRTPNGPAHGGGSPRCR